MPSSTSSSSSRMPSAPYIRIWLGALLLVALLLGLSEASWRKRGYLPNVSDTKIFWSSYRDNVYTRGGKKRLVVAGASRAQVGLDPEVLAAAFPEFEVVHLAIDGAPPLAIVEDLCLDADFDGIILCSTTAPMLIQNAGGEPRKDQEYVDYYHQTFESGAGIEKRINGTIAAYFQSKMVISSAVLSSESLVANRFDPPRLGQHMRFNRFRPAYYFDRLSPDQLRDNRQRRVQKHSAQLEQVLSVSDVEEFAKHELRELNAKLSSRGGALVLVRMPTSDEHWEIDETIAPKEQFWDHLQDWSNIPAIHFRDYRELADFKCPDTSHLEASDAREFTLRLAGILPGVLAMNK